MFDYMKRSRSCEPSPEDHPHHIILLHNQVFVSSILSRCSEVLCKSIVHSFARARAAGEWSAVTAPLPPDGPSRIGYPAMRPWLVEGQMQFHQLKQFGHGERPHTASVQLRPSPLLGRRRFMLGTAANLGGGRPSRRGQRPGPLRLERRATDG